MSITQTPEPAVIRPQRRLGEFDGYVIVEEQSTDSLEITQHPVQDGSSITDHAFLLPQELTMRIMYDDAQRPLQETYEKLRKLQSDREPFDVITGKRIYRNMLIGALTETTDKETENILYLTMTMQEVIIVQVEVTTVPPRAKQKSPARTSGTSNAGAKSAKAPANNSPKRQQSILASARPS